MMVQLKPETERLVREEIRRGHFSSVDEIISEGLAAWREKHSAEDSETKPIKRIYDLVSQPPFAGSELHIERQRECPRPIEL